MRRLGATLLLTAAGLASMWVLAPAAAAHAALVSSDPADGAQLKVAPAAVTMTFSESPDPKLSVVHVLDAAGSQVEAAPVASVPGDPKQLRETLKSGLPDGVYTVSWRVVSEADGHVTAGAFAFGVGVPAGTVRPSVSLPATPGPSPLAVVGKVLLYAGLSVVVGAAATGLLAFGGRLPSRGVLLPVAGLSAVAGAGAMLVAERATVGASMSALLSSSAGHAYIWLLALCLLTEAAAVIAAVRPSNGTLALAGGTAAAAMLARAIGGHAGAAGSAWLQVLVQWLHFLAVGVWIGGFLPLLLLVRQRRIAGEPSPIDEVRRFSSMAAISLVVVVGTGIVRAVSGMGLHEVIHLFSTSYGTTLALKVAVVAVLVAFGAVNRYRSIPRLGEGPGLLLRVVTFEVVAAIGVFTLTGVLTGLAPRPQRATTPSGITEIVATGSDAATTMKVRLVVAPGDPGLNTYQLTPTDYDTGASIPAVGVTLRFQPQGRPDVAASSVDLRAGSSGTWVGKGTQLSIQGSWQVTAVIQTASGGVEVPMTLTTASPPQQVSVNRQAGQPDLYTITLPGGVQIQAYNDPGSPGPNQLHMTAFDASGSELPLASASVTAIPPQGALERLDLTRFSQGHFVASVDLTPGIWRFELGATTRDGGALLASFDQTIATSGSPSGTPTNG